MNMNNIKSREELINYIIPETLNLTLNSKKELPAINKLKLFLLKDDRYYDKTLDIYSNIYIFNIESYVYYFSILRETPFVKNMNFLYNINDPSKSPSTREDRLLQILMNYLDNYEYEN